MTSTPDMFGSWSKAISDITGLRAPDVNFAINSTINTVIAFAAGGLISQIMGGDFIKGGTLSAAIRGVWDAFAYFNSSSPSVSPSEPRVSPAPGGAM